MVAHDDHLLNGRRRPDYHLIASLVPAGARVLDLGCGDGQLLALLESTKGCRVQGIEINDRAAAACLRRGVPVYHGDMLEGMGFIRAGAFDVVILSQTLQQTMRPVAVMHEMLRVGRQAVISFPNFGYWLTRLQLLVSGRMPRHGLLPYPWYSTPNVHLCTIVDFRELCQQEDLAITAEILLTPSHRHIGPLLANWRAGLAIMQVERKGSRA